MQASNNSTPQPVAELIAMVRQVLGRRGTASGELSVAERLVLGQRLLFAAIPFAERLAESGPARKQALLQVIELAQLELEPDRADQLAVIFALDALRFALESGLEEAIVASFKDRGGHGGGGGARPCVRSLLRCLGMAD
jgi:hypothetical protein